MRRNSPSLLTALTYMAYFLHDDWRGRIISPSSAGWRTSCALSLLGYHRERAMLDVGAQMATAYHMAEADHLNEYGLATLELLEPEATLRPWVLSQPVVEICYRCDTGDLSVVRLAEYLRGQLLSAYIAPPLPDARHTSEPWLL